MRALRPVLVLALGGALVLAPPAVAAGTTPSTTLLPPTQATNPLAPGFPQQGVPTPTTTTAVPTISTSATAGGGSGFSGSSALIIAIGAIVVLGGISLFIWRDARRRAPTRHRVAAAGMGDEGRRKGSKQRAKPRKLSPAERRRRKRGRAR